MHILVATGGSTHSQIALEQCRAIAKTTAVDVTILTVVENEEQAQAENLLREAASYLSPLVNSVKTLQRVGQAATEILSEAAADKYDLLILGEKSQHSLLTRLMGPTAQRVVSQAEIPVLLAKQQAHDLKHILICDGGDQELSVADRFTAALPQLLDAAQDAIVLHVMSQISAAPGITGRDLRAGARELIKDQTPEGEWLAQDLEVLEQVDIKATPKVRHGLVVDEILAEATDGRYDLIVIGAHPHEGWQRFLLEDVAAKIVLEADRPVLVIPYPTTISS